VTETTITPFTQGVYHVGLTVSEVFKIAIFTVILGMNEVSQRPGYPVIFVSDGVVMITLWQAKEPATATAFNRQINIGLQHVALTIADAEQRDVLCARSKKTIGVEIEFTPESLGSNSFHHIVRRIPGGVRVESIMPG
jgi:hypothetical protein